MRALFDRIIPFEHFLSYASLKLRKDERFDGVCNAIFPVCFRDKTSPFLDFIWCVAHRDAYTRQIQHRQIVLFISSSHDLIGSDSKMIA